MDLHPHTGYKLLCELVMQVEKTVFPFPKFPTVFLYFIQVGLGVLQIFTMQDINSMACGIWLVQE